MASNEAAQQGVIVHPLVLLNVVEHALRAVSDTMHCGLIYGTTTAGSTAPTSAAADDAIDVDGDKKWIDADVAYSMDAPNPAATSSVSWDMSFIAEHTHLVKQVFPKYSLLGWYATGADVTPSHATLHNQLTSSGLSGLPSPLFLRLNTATIAPDARTLPVDVMTMDARGNFTSVPFRVSASDSEKFMADFIVSETSQLGEAGDSAYVKELRTQRNAVQMLDERLSAIENYLSQVAEGAIPPDRRIFRQISAVCSGVPAADSSAFHEALRKTINDDLTVSLLAALSHGSETASDLLHKSRVLAAHAEGRGEKGPRMFGLT